MPDFRTTFHAACVAKRKELKRLLVASEVFEVGCVCYAAQQLPVKAPKKQTKPKYVIPPAPSDVTAYSEEIGYPMDGQKWCDNYAQKGWIVSGKARMTDWKAACRNWKHNEWGQESKIALKKLPPKPADVRYSGEPLGDWRSTAREVLNLEDLPPLWSSWWEVPPEYREKIAKAM